MRGASWSLQQRRCACSVSAAPAALPCRQQHGRSRVHALGCGRVGMHNLQGQSAAMEPSKSSGLPGAQGRQNQRPAPPRPAAAQAGLCRFQGRCTGGRPTPAPSCPPLPADLRRGTSRRRPHCCRRRSRPAASFAGPPARGAQLCVLRPRKRPSEASAQRCKARSLKPVASVTLASMAPPEGPSTAEESSGRPPYRVGCALLAKKVRCAPNDGLFRCCCAPGALGAQRELPREREADGRESLHAAVGPYLLHLGTQCERAATARAACATRHRSPPRRPAGQALPDAHDAAHRGGVRHRAAAHRCRTAARGAGAL